MAVYHVSQVKVEFELCRPLYNVLVSCRPVECLLCTLCVCSMDVLEALQVRMVNTLWVIQWHTTRFCVLNAVEFIHKKLHMLIYYLSTNSSFLAHALNE